MFSSRIFFPDSLLTATSPLSDGTIASRGMAVVRDPSWPSAGRSQESGDSAGETRLRLSFRLFACIVFRLCLPCLLACLPALLLTLLLLALFMHYTCLNTCLTHYTCLLSGKCFVLHNCYATTHAHAIYTCLLI